MLLLSGVDGEEVRSSFLEGLWCWLQPEIGSDVSKGKKIGLTSDLFLSDLFLFAFEFSFSNSF